MLQLIYLVLCIAGTILPYSQLAAFLPENGFDLPLFLEQLLVNAVSRFAWVDIIISSLALWCFVFSEGSRLGMKNLWVYVLSNLLVGVSLALPLFLLMRERQPKKVDSSIDSSLSFSK